MSEVLYPTFDDVQWVALIITLEVQCSGVSKATWYADVFASAPPLNSMGTSWSRSTVSSCGRHLGPS